MFENNLRKIDFQLNCDYHSHILPRIDDGAGSSQESLALIDAAKMNGVDRIYATPHCYLHKIDVEKFCRRRAGAFERLQELRPGLQIELGAELLLFPGIDSMDGIEKLTMGDTDTLLIELPLSESIITEEYYLTIEALSQRFHILMAHANRYSEYTVRQMREVGADIQVNACDVCNWKQRKRVIDWLEGDCSIALGSDVHGGTKAYKQFAKAKKILSKYK